MGWSILFDLGPLAQAPTGAIALLAAGGISYTIGGMIYGLKKPDLFRSFGFHELFHCFVLLGSVLHYLVVAILHSVKIKPCNIISNTKYPKKSSRFLPNGTSCSFIEYYL